MQLDAFSSAHPTRQADEKNLDGNSVSSNIIEDLYHGRICSQARRNRCPTYPGELLREDVIPATGKTRSEIAALLGISRPHLYDILNERKPVSPTDAHLAALASMQR